jgi:hypothetical protein
MAFQDEWVVASFEVERGVGKVKDPQGGTEHEFDVEAWTPCEPGIALVLAESERRRHLLLPQAGEPVDVVWKDASRGGKPAKVLRREPLGIILPPLSFATWVWRMGHHVEHLARWTDEEWSTLYQGAEEGIEEVVRSNEPSTPELHLAFLEVLRDHAPPPVCRRFKWLENVAKPGLTAVESFNDSGTIFVNLPPDVIAKLVEERLILLG